MKETKKKICNGCNEKLNKGDKFVKIDDLILCENCVENNWHENE